MISLWYENILSGHFNFNKNLSKLPRFELHKEVVDVDDESNAAKHLLKENDR